MISPWNTRRGGEDLWFHPAIDSKLYQRQGLTLFKARVISNNNNWRDSASIAEDHGEAIEGGRAAARVHASARRRGTSHDDWSSRFEQGGSRARPPLSTPSLEQLLKSKHEPEQAAAYLHASRQVCD